MSMIYGKSLVSGGGVNKYTIEVVVEEGSSVTGVCDGTTVTFQEVSTGVYRATVTKAGIWTITATKTGAVVSTTIDVKSTYNNVLAYKASAFTSAQSGIDYVNGVPNDWNLMKEIGQLISDASDSITANTTESIYVNKGTMWAYKITPGDTITVNGYNYAVMGFNNYQLTDKANYGGNNTYAGLTFGMIDICGDYLMQSGATNSGGWGACEMRTSTMKTLKTGMPSTMAQVAIPYYGYANSTTMQYANDYMFLPAEKEVFGSRSDSPSGEANALTQYAYYKNGGSKIKKYASGSSAWWWLRSIDASYNQNFCIVNPRGNVTGSTMSLRNGTSPCFCV